MKRTYKKNINITSKIIFQKLKYISLTLFLQEKPYILNKYYSGLPMVVWKVLQIFEITSFSVQIKFDFLNGMKVIKRYCDATLNMFFIIIQ